MSPAFSVRRRADQFDALVSGRAAPDDARSGRYAGLLAVVDELRDLPEVSPRPEFSADLRERLLLAADTALVPADTDLERLRIPGRQVSRRDRRLATVLGGAALVGATTSMAVAAQTALPGDSLYPVKRALEEAETGLADSGAERGHTLLANASGRLDEVNALALRGTAEGIAAVPDTLVAFEAQSTEASQVLLDVYENTGEEQAIADLRDFVHESMQTLQALESELPDIARDELVAAARTLTEIDDLARQLCPSCGGAGITELPHFLLSAGNVSERGVAPSLVPAAQLPVRPAPAPRERRKHDSGSDDPQLALPDLDLDDPDDGDGDGESQDTTDTDTSTRTPDDGGGTNGDGGDPLGDLADTVRDEGTSPANADDPVDDIVDGVGDAADELADDLLGGTLD